MKKIKQILNQDVKRWIERAMAHPANQTDIESWKLYYNKFNPDDYSYITQVKGKNLEGETIELSYPAKFRWIPIVKKNLNVLISTQQLRPFIYNLSNADQEGIRRKFHAAGMGIADIMMRRAKQIQQNYVMKLEQLESQEQEINQMLSAEPQSKQEANQIQQLRLQMPFIRAEINKVRTDLENKEIFSRQDLDKYKKYYTYDAKDIVEEIGHKVALKIRKSNRFKTASNSCFVSRIVTGKPFYYVNHNPGDKNVTIRHESEFNIVYPNIPDIEWTHELPWIMLNKRISYSDAKRMYGHLLSDDELKTINDQKVSRNPHPVFISTETSEDSPNPHAVILNEDYDGSNSSGMTNHEDTVAISYIWYTIEKPLYAVITPNKYMPSRPHIWFVTEDKIEERKEKKKAGERIEKRYFSERHYGIILNKNIYIGFERDEIQPRDVNNMSKVYLPIIGRTNSSITQQPSSLVQDTKDLNELYQVINYHRELYIAVSGVRGQIVDVSQKPTDMSLTEHRYHRKIGTLYIQTKDPNGRNLSSFYNQWKSYDDTISQSVNQLDNMLLNLEETMGIIMGVNRQRIGQTVSTDQVGTNEQAVRMANLVTERLHYEHDEQDSMALEHAVNIHMNYLLKPGDIISVPTEDDSGVELFRVPEIDLKNSQVHFYAQNNNKQQDIKNKLEQLATAEYQKGGLPLYALTKVYNIENIKTLEKELEKYSRDAEKIRQLELTNQAEAEKEKERLKNEIDLQITQMDIEAKMAQLQFEKEKLGIDSQIKAREIASKEGVEMLKIATERETEGAFLQEQNRASLIDEEIEFLKLKLDAVLRTREIEVNEKIGMKRNSEQAAKAKSVSTNKKVKEKIVD